MLFRSTYDSNEIMYTKLAAGGITVDVIIPSDYMIARLISEDMLLELDFNNIPNYSYVDEADLTGWDVLWNEKYKGKILMFDNSRDAFGIAQYLLGYGVNTTSKDELLRCAEKLTEQKPLVQQYVMDQIYSTMENGEAYLAPYYAGDCMLMMESNPDLKFYLPESDGFNFFIDAMCIPTCCQEKEAAELFINFLCDPEISGANMDYICYASPISAAKDYMEDYLRESEVVYPSEEVLSKGTAYAFLSEEISRYVENLYQKATKVN